MHNPLVTIIVPVYNAEKTLQRCIDSLRMQTYKNTEMIFVDDGSADSSYSILQQAAKIDARIRVFSQENAGPSAARNLGMDHCTGEYIMFCDSDDTVEPTWTEKMVDTIQEHPDALVTCGFRGGVDENGNIMKMHTMPSGVYDKNEYFQYYYSGLSGSSCNKIYRRDIIFNGGLRFDVNFRYSEDAMLNLDYLECVKEIFILSELLYNYYAPRSMDTLSSGVNYWQLRTIFRKRAAYIEPKYIDQYNKEFFFFAWSEIKDTLQNKDLGIELQVKHVRQIVADHVFQELLNAYGEELFDRYSRWMLKNRAVRCFWLIQKIHHWKNDFKRKVK